MHDISSLSQFKQFIEHYLHTVRPLSKYPNKQGHANSSLGFSILLTLLGQEVHLNLEF